MSGMTQQFRALLVDDEPDFPELAASCLEREADRLTADTAGNSDAGLEHLADHE